MILSKMTVLYADYRDISKNAMTEAAYRHLLPMRVWPAQLSADIWEGSYGGVARRDTGSDIKADSASL